MAFISICNDFREVDGESELDLIAYYKFNEGKGRELFDSSFNKRITSFASTKPDNEIWTADLDLIICPSQFIFDQEANLCICIV